MCFDFRQASASAWFITIFGSIRFSFERKQFWKEMSATDYSWKLNGKLIIEQSAICIVFELNLVSAENCHRIMKNDRLTAKRIPFEVASALATTIEVEKLCAVNFSLTKNRRPERNERKMQRNFLFKHLSNENIKNAIAIVRIACSTSFASRAAPLIFRRDISCPSACAELNPSKFWQFDARQDVR